MLEHGGKLKQAAQRYSIALEHWLDLSTGINPVSWPVPALPPTCWSRLPDDEDNLIASASAYYGACNVLAVAGSQAAIQTLPQLRKPASRVSVLNPGYAEHRYAWQRAGHIVTPVCAQNIEAAVATSDVVILIQPNNPTGVCFPLEQLLTWQQQLATRDGWLVVDEAFIDASPLQSLVPHSQQPGLIVLRSLGKFFGLAGARVGFVFAHTPLLAQIKTQLGPWTLSTPARWVASAALQDVAWQQKNRQLLQQASTRLHDLLNQHGLTPTGGTALFQWVCTTAAQQHHEQLAQHAILTRLFTDPPSLRFGLPGTETEWKKLRTALTELRR